MKNKWLIVFLLIAYTSGVRADNCHGSFPNPITDTCWACMFPINIAGMAITGSESQNHDPSPPTFCVCPAPAPFFERPGVGVSLWEPWRIVEAVRSPGCLPTLNGLKTELPGSEGTNNTEPGVDQDAYYHMHIFSYPILTLVYGTVIDTICFQTSSASFDMLYATEVDPLWADDDTASIFSPEVFLLNTPLAQAACIADTVSAAVTGFGLDLLYWCAGSQGSVFPLSGSHNNHIGGIDSSLAKTHSFLFKLQRHAAITDTSSYGSICQPSTMSPYLKKNQFKQQSLSPVAHPSGGFGFGQPSQLWSAGYETPAEGEDFTYMIWRKRLCCGL